MPETPPPNHDADVRVFDKLVVESTNARVGVSPEGGYVTSWQVKNSNSGIFEDVLYVGTEIRRTGIPILFPNFSESGGEVPFHGFGRDSLWTVEQVPGSSSVTMKLNSDDISEEAKATYPYKFEVTIKVEAVEDGSMLYSLKVKNLDEKKDMPIAPGLHPYWAIPHKDKARIQVEGAQGFNAESFEWGTNPPDNEYDFSGKAIIRMPQRIITIEDITPDGPVMNNIVAWSQTPQKPDYEFVCFEPTARRSGALTKNPIIVPAGGEWNMNLRFSSTPT
jgi:galactose mutarotase-like enzyme